MAVLFQDIINQTNDYIRNYTTGTIDLGNRSRAVNRAIEFYQRRMGLPSDENIYRFYFTQATFYYDLPSDYNEAWDLIYDNYDLNYPGQEWYYLKPNEVLRQAGMQPAQRYWSVVTFNGQSQLLMLGQNVQGGALIDSFQQATNANAWSGTGDASNLVVGGAQVPPNASYSLQFTITPSTGTATLQNTHEAIDFSSYHNLNAWFYLYIYMPTTNFTSINFQFGSDSSNYYTISVTANADGTAWQANHWNLVAFQFMNAVITSGNPIDTNITFFKFNFVEGAGFTTQTQMRISYFLAQIPDYMDLLYYGNIKGTDSQGQRIQNLSAPSDTALFGNIAPDLIDPIARRAALSLVPQLRQDPAFIQEYKQDVDDLMKIWGRTYPRKKILNFGRTRLRRDGGNNGNYPYNNTNNY